jgi:hypothetical protein
VTAPAHDRIEGAIQWAELACEIADPTARAAHRSAVDLLHLVAWRGLTRATQERRLADWVGVPSRAAAYAIAAGDPALAVELLEHGGAVLWSQRLHRHPDLARLQTVEPVLAKRLDELRDRLERPADDGTDRAVLAREWDRVVDMVQARPGFASFLDPPTAAQLVPAGAEGPVVIVNVPVAILALDKARHAPTAYDYLSAADILVDVLNR